MKLLLVLVAVSYCSASLFGGKHVQIGEDGNIVITNDFGRTISITKPIGYGGKSIEIDVSGPNVPTKRIIVDNTNVHEDSIDDLDFNRTKRGSKVPIRTQGDILTQIFEAYQGVVDETSYQKLLSKIEKYVSKGEVNQTILDLLRNLGAQGQEVLVQNPWLLQQTQIQHQQPSQHIVGGIPQGVNVQGVYPGVGLGGGQLQQSYPLGGQYGYEGYPYVYGRGGVVGQGDYPVQSGVYGQLLGQSSWLYPEQQSGVPVSSSNLWLRRYLQGQQLGGQYGYPYGGQYGGEYGSQYGGQYLDQSSVPVGQYYPSQLGGQYLNQDVLQGGSQSEYPVYGQQQGGVEQSGIYGPNSYLWRRLLTPVQRQRIQEYVWSRLGGQGVQSVLGHGYPSIWDRLLTSGSGGYGGILNQQQQQSGLGQGIYGGGIVRPQVVV